MELQLQRENNLSSNIKRAFLDRSPIDGLAYCQFYHKKISENRKKVINQICENNEYKIIFLIENLGKDVQSNMRAENLEASLQIEKKLEKTYTDLGFLVIKIPPESLQKRINLILNIIKDFEKDQNFNN